MNKYRFVQTRRRRYQLRDEEEIIAQITLGKGTRATVSTASEEFELDVVPGIRPRVVRQDRADSTIARAASTAKFAIDLPQVTLYWQSLAKFSVDYGWALSDGSVVVSYAATAGGSTRDFIVEVDSEALALDVIEHVLTIGAYLLALTCIELAPITGTHAAARAPSLAFSRGAR